ncbi:MAG: hypothetical protein ACJ78D_08820, partial [Gemmatimonadaceae bacterium]
MKLVVFGATGNVGQRVVAEALRHVALLAFAVGQAELAAGQTAWQPSPGHRQVPIWPAAIPDAQP